MFLHIKCAYKKLRGQLPLMPQCGSAPANTLQSRGHQLLFNFDIIASLQLKVKSPFTQILETN
jgi:hypothetical protein